MAIRKIAVNTGGGDAPGLNAVLRAVQKQAAAEAATNAKREAAFKAELARQQKLLGEAMQARNAAEALSNSLSQRLPLVERPLQGSPLPMVCLHG